MTNIKSATTKITSYQGAIKERNDEHLLLHVCSLEDFRTYHKAIQQFKCYNGNKAIVDIVNIILIVSTC